MCPSPSADRAAPGAVAATAPVAPAPAPASAVLALGAWLKNAACLLEAGVPHVSEVHGDLGDPRACLALEASAAALLQHAPRGVAAIAHDLHPDFFSTRLAVRLAAELGVPALGVQHHHAHIAAVMAEHGLRTPVIGLALDGVGLGTDGQAWGGELLCVDAQGFSRLGHLGLLPLPGGDVAAREPWRMAAAALHALGRGDEIEPRFAPVVGAPAARGVRYLIQRALNCPPTSSTGRWFDAAAGALGLSVRQSQEAEAAIALERAAARGLAAHGEPADQPLAGFDADGVLDLRPLLARLLDTPRDAPDAVDAAAAGFHAALAASLAAWAADAAQRHDIDTVCLGGGCFFNAVLTGRVTHALEARRLRVLRPLRHSCGDAGLALGQAWAATMQLETDARSASNESLSCA
jgi:hydrogenase maturation protein HypF